ncbi:MAG TPA: HAD family hydrolase [Actinomycetes bacterium]|nr:HAD family hydrolase [Actinomycetes bacterium]
MAGTQVLRSWNEGAAKTAIIDFVEHTTTSGIPVEERIATFDADGTLWCEKPAPVEADFLLRRLADMAQADPKLREKQPWKAAYERDMAWLGQAISQHYAGNDTMAQTLLSGITNAYAGVGVEEFEARADSFLRSAQNPHLGRGYLETSYLPMVELLAYLETNGFSNYIVSGSGADFMRPVTAQLFGIPAERVIGSAAALKYSTDGEGGTITHEAKLGFLDDGPEKAVQVWSRIGRRPLVAGGNSNGDIPMLDFTQHKDKPSLRVLVLHDDAEREFAYTTGAEQALERAKSSGWTVVSMKNDFATVFASTDREGTTTPS